MVRKNQRTKDSVWRSYSPYVAGYVRGRNSSDTSGLTVREQKRQIREYVENNEVTLVDIIVENDKADSGFINTLQLCRTRIFPDDDKTGSQFKFFPSLLYVDMGNWNSSSSFKKKLAALHDDTEYKKYTKMNTYRRRVRPIAIDADQRLMEALHREALLENRGKKVHKIPRPLNEGIERPDGIGARRFNNFLHLTYGACPIIDILNQKQQSTHADLAKLLNADCYLTVDGKPWSPDNVRKVRKEFEKNDFLEFAKMRRHKESNGDDD
jgi:hypothetical protein